MSAESMRGARVIVAPVVLQFHLEAARFCRKRDLSRFIVLTSESRWPRLALAASGGGSEATAEDRACFLCELV